MGFLKLLMYWIVMGLIRIGDAVSFSASFFPRYVYKSFHSIGRKKKQKGASKTISSRGVLFSSPLRKRVVRKSKDALFLLRSFLSICNILLIGFFEFLVRFSIECVVRLTVFLYRTIFFPLFIFKRLFTQPTSSQKKVVYKTRFRSKILYFGMGAVIAFVFVYVPSLSYIFLSELPQPTELASGYIPKTTKIYDRNDQLLYEIYVNQNRSVVRLEQIPLHLRQATIAIEDKDFYSHPGFDIRGISRALVTNIRTDELQGGSTITQQLVKSALLTPEPTISRKVKEIVLAFWAERIYEKDQVLEMYFNFVPYGGTAWGIGAASETYFGKSVDGLTLAEGAFLAGLPRAPSVYSPHIGDEDVWKGRQRDVLKAMVRDGYITQQQADEAYNYPLEFEEPKSPIQAPHFVMYVRDVLIKEYGISAVERGGLHIRTTLDLELQKKVESVVQDEVARNEYLLLSNGAAVVTDPNNGDVLAMVGSRDYFDRERDGNVNVALAKRQPGSTIKLVTYALALQSGMTEATVLDDKPLSIDQPGQAPYVPVNYDGQFHGKVPLRYALANSYNIPAILLAQKLGPDKVVEFGSEMGIESWRDLKTYGVSVTLGGAEVTMLDLATAYGTIANEGVKVELDPILEVRDSYGALLSTKKPRVRQVVNEGVAFILSDILSDNVARSREFGSSSPLFIPGKKVSVKTGTTDEKRDNWTVGFTDDYVVAVWVGNNDNTPMSPSLTSGLSGAAPIWHTIMLDLLGDDAADADVASIPPSVVKKSCFGRDAYFVRGTEQGVRCAFPPTPTSIPQVQ